MSFHLDSSSSEYLDLNKKQGKTKKQKYGKVSTDPHRTSNQSVKLTSLSTSSTTLSPLTDTSYESVVVSQPKEAEVIRLVNTAKLVSANTASDPIDNTSLEPNLSKSLIESLNILRLYNDTLTPKTYSVGKLLGSEDSEYSVLVQKETVSSNHESSRNDKAHPSSSSQPEVKFIYNQPNQARRLSENEAVQTPGENIHPSKKELDHWEYETPLSDYWYITPPEDPKMALISLLVETHRRIIGSREHPNLSVRNSVDYGLSSLKVNCDIDPDCCGCIWPFINPEESPENLKDKHGNRKYYFLTSDGQGYDWDDQNFSAPLTYLLDRRKKLKEDVLMMKEELFYITEKFLTLSKKFRHQIVRDSRLRKRFESVGLDLVYKRAHLDNMHHLYHRVKKLYEAYLPLCNEA